MTADTRLPDSDLARRADRYVAELSPPALRNHCTRTFLLADAAGRRQGLRYDRELLYLGAVLHDLGLTDRFNGGPDRFEVSGADAAVAFAAEHGLPADKHEVLWDAVALHTSVGIVTRKRPEVALVAVGTAMDVAGVGLAALDPAEVERVVADYPRLGWDEAVAGLVLAHVRKAPRAAALTWLAEVGRAGLPGFACPTFLDLLAASPWRNRAAADS